VAITAGPAIDSFLSDWSSLEWSSIDQRQ